MSDALIDRRSAPPSGRHDSDLLVALMFVVAALVLRSPALLYSEINFDEAMYMLMGREIAEGHLPYTTMCDLKPVGLFALFSLFSMVPFDGIVASRIGASLAVAACAYMVFRISILFFAGDGRRIGIVAGAVYIVFSLATGGLTSQGEIFHNVFALLGLLLALRGCIGRPAPSVAWFAAAGLALGMGVQIKQSVLFDMLAFLAGYFILTTPSLRGLPAHARRALPALGALALASTVATLVIIGAYILDGTLDAWVRGNITTHTTFYEDGGMLWENALRAMAEQTLIWIGAVAALIGARRLVRDGFEVRVMAFLAVWTMAILILQLFLRIGADHYWLQFLPVLGLLNGFFISRVFLVHLSGWRPRAALLGLLTVISVFAVAQNPYTNAFLVGVDRFVKGDAWAGDTPRRIAADIAPKVEPGDEIYVVGFQPAVYYLVDAEPATRFVFTGLPHRDHPERDGCTWLPQDEEMRRVLDRKPRFIVVEDGVFFHELRAPVKGPLEAALAEDYEEAGRYEPHVAHWWYPFQQFVMNGGAAAWVYERRPDAEQEPGPAVPGAAPGTDTSGGETLRSGSDDA